MNFLKVKKFMFVFLFSFFISCGFVNAKSGTAAIYVNNSDRGELFKDNFNIFEEMSVSSSFYKFLNARGNALIPYLVDVAGITKVDGSNFDYFIMTCSDIANSKGTLSYAYASNENNYCFNRIVDNNHKYVIIAAPKLKFNIELSDIHLRFYPFVGYSNVVTGNNNDTFVFYFNSKGEFFESLNIKDALCDDYYKEDLTLVDDNFICRRTGVDGSYYNFDIQTVEYYSDLYGGADYADMTSWYTYFYNITLNDFDSDYSEFYTSAVFENGNIHNIKDAAGNSWWSNFIFGLQGSSYDTTQISNWGLDFVQNDYFYRNNSLFSLYDYWYSSSSFNVPSGYTSLSLNDGSSYGYYFTPKKCSDNSNFSFYFYSDTSTSSYKINFNYFLKNSENLLDYYNSYYVYSSKNYALYHFNPRTFLDITNNDFYNYTLNVALSSLVSDYVLYYNPSCYNLYDASSSSLTLSFSDDSTVILDSATVKDFYTKYNSTTLTPSFTDNNNDGINDSDSGFNLPNVDDVIKNIPNYVSGFVISIGALVNVAYAFLFGLPPEIFGFLFSIFIVGAVIIIIKLVRGG